MQIQGVIDWIKRLVVESRRLKHFIPAPREGAVMDFPTAIETCLRKYVTYKGRASRSECWYFWLFFILCYSVPFILAILGLPYDVFHILGVVVFFGLLSPTFSVGARRLHDVNRSGWWAAILPVPFFAALLVVANEELWIKILGGLLLAAGSVGAIRVIVWFCTKGDPGKNRYSLVDEDE
jgi:uncharacterized membrane protein YhaH (DUF805 family)